MRRNIRLLVSLALVPAFALAACGDTCGLACQWVDPTTLLASDADIGADAATGPDGFVPQDVVIGADRGDTQVVFVDQPVVFVDAGDAGTAPDVQTVPDNGTGTDVVDAGQPVDSGTDAGFPVDMGTPVDTGVDAGTAPDVQTPPDTGNPVDVPVTPDAGFPVDMPVVTDRGPADTGVDAGFPVDMGVDAGPDVRDVPVVIDNGPPPVDVYTGPALRLVYIHRNPPGGSAPAYIQYGYDATYLGTVWTQCPVRLITGTGNQYECVPENLPAGTTGVWFAAQDVCGDGVGTECPPSTSTTGWRFNYRVEWYGWPYTATSTATTASGPAPAITDHAPAQCGRYRNNCVHAPLPVVRP